MPKQLPPVKQSSVDRNEDTVGGKWWAKVPTGFYITFVISLILAGVFYVDKEVDKIDKEVDAMSIQPITPPEPKPLFINVKHHEVDDGVWRREYTYMEDTLGHKFITTGSGDIIQIK